MSETVEVDRESLETVLEYVAHLNADARCPGEVGEAATLLEREVFEDA